MASQHTWNTIDSAKRVFTTQYQSGPYLATTLVVGMGPDELCICSPPATTDLSVYYELERHGRVVAIVAPNAFHHAGLLTCRQRHPGAPIYAARDVAKKLCKKVPEIGPEIRPIEDLSRALPAGVEIFVPPHLRTSDTMARIQTNQGAIWYVTEIVGNRAAPEKSVILRLLFWMTKSGPGFAVNKLVCLAMLKDKKKFRAWLLDELRQHPPHVLVVGHGKPLNSEGLPDKLTALIEAAL